MHGNMRTRQDAIDYCMTFPGAVEDYPFHDENWTVMRHKNNKKVFAWIFEREGNIWINLKCDPEWRDMWRSTFASVIPAYHLNKEHWNSIILDGTIPEKEIEQMIGESYDLTEKKKKKKIQAQKSSKQEKN